MALTLSELQTMRDDLVRAIASGNRRVTFRHGDGDRTQEYQSIEEMLKALELLDSQIADLANTDRSRYSLAKFSRG